VQGNGQYGGCIGRGVDVPSNSATGRGSPQVGHWFDSQSVDDTGEEIGIVDPKAAEQDSPVFGKGLLQPIALVPELVEKILPSSSDGQAPEALTHTEQRLELVR
jgi:hypothetical protein